MVTGDNLIALVWPKLPEVRAVPLGRTATSTRFKCASRLHHLHAAIVWPNGERRLPHR